MAEPVAAGSDVSAGTYRCAECGYQLQVQLGKKLVKRLSDQTATLVHQELDLAKAELTAKVLALVGKNKVKEGVPPAPEQALESVKEDVQWTKQRAKEGRR